jgi:hypothetical protein
MSKIYKFPESKITSDVEELKKKNLEAHEENKAYRYSQIEDVALICQYELISFLEMQGFDVDNYDFVEHFSFAMEALRSCLLQSAGLDHPLQQIKPNLQRLLDNWPDS